MKNKTYIEFGHSNIKAFNDRKSFLFDSLDDFKDYTRKYHDKLRLLFTSDQLRPDILSFFSKNSYRFIELRKENIIKSLKYDYNLKDIGIDRMILCEYLARETASDVVFISFGTAITFNIIQKNTFKGGAIIPSAYLMYKSLKELSGIKNKITDEISHLISHDLDSNNTHQSVKNGIYGMIRSYIDEYIGSFKDAVFYATGNGIEHKIILKDEKIIYDKDLFSKAVTKGKYLWKD